MRCLVFMTCLVLSLLACARAPDALPYVGEWASTHEDCANPPFAFTANSVTTLGGVACRFDDVREDGAGGYAVKATCPSEAPRTQFNITIAFPKPEKESQREMVVDGAPFAAPVFYKCS